MKKNYYAHLNRMYIKYNKLVKSLQKIMNNGRFVKYAQKRQAQLLNVLSHYEAQLKKAGLVIGTSLALMMPPSTAHAQPAKLGTPIQVNTSAAQDQTASVVAVDDNGDFAVTWMNYDTTTSTFDVYLQRFDNTGAKQGNEVQVNSNSIVYFGVSQIAMDNDGDFVVAWLGLDPTDSAYKIFTQRYDNNGIAQGGETPISAATVPVGALYPAIGMNNNGGFTVAWSAYDATTMNSEIYMQRIDSTGTMQGTEMKVGVSGDIQTNPAIAMDDEGDFVVSWQAGDTTAYDIYIQRYDNNGVAQGTETKVNTSTNPDHSFPSIAMDAHGDFVVTWTEEDNMTGAYSVHMQRYNPNGVAQGSQTQVNPAGTSGRTIDHAVELDETGNFVVVWTAESGNQYDVYGQAYKSTGATIGSAFLIAGNNNNEFSRGLAMQPDGDFIVNYDNDATSHYDVYVQRYTGGLPTNIGNQALDSELNIYPNPVGNELFLEASAQGTVKVYNMLGQAIKEISLNNSTISIDVSDLPMGQYLLEVTGEEGERKTKKFIKQ